MVLKRRRASSSTTKTSTTRISKSKPNSSTTSKSLKSQKKPNRNLDQNVDYDGPDSDDENGGPNSKKSKKKDNDSDDDNIFSDGNDSDDSTAENKNSSRETVDERRIRLAKKLLSDMDLLGPDGNRKNEASDNEDDEEGNINGNYQSADSILRSHEEKTAVKAGRQVDWSLGSRLRLGAKAKSKSKSSTDSDDTGVSFHRGHLGPVTTVCMGQSNTLYSAAKDCAIIDWDLNTMKKRRIFPGKRKDFYCGGHFESVLALGYSENLNLLCSGGMDRIIRLWDTRIGSSNTTSDIKQGCVTQLRGHSNGITGLCISEIGNENSSNPQLYSSSLDKSIRLWDLRHRQELNMFLGHTEPIYAMDMNHSYTNSSSLSNIKCRPVTGSSDKSVRLWKPEVDSHLVFGDTSAMSNTGLISASTSSKDNDVIKGHRSSVDAVLGLQHDSLFVSGGQDGNIHVWSSDKAAPVCSALGAHDSSNSLSNSSSPSSSLEPGWISSLGGGAMNSNWFCSGSSDGILRAWTIEKEDGKFNSNTNSNSGAKAAANFKSSSSRAKSTKYSLSLNSQTKPGQIPGMINSIVDGGKDFVICGVGREHRLGRWHTANKGSKDGIAIVKKRYNIEKEEDEEEEDEDEEEED